MADKRCEACSDLQEESPSFVQNGVTKTICNSLKNNTGFNPSSGNDDCEDLDKANDCLVGNMEDMIDAYDVCSWKDYMRKFVPNVWTVFKAIICAICGLWTNVEKLWCHVEHLSKDTGGTIHAYVDDDPTKAPLNGFRAVSGVSVRTGSAPMSISIHGTIARVTGSIHLEGNMPASYTGSGARMKWTDIYNGGTEFTNAAGNSSKHGNVPLGGLLLYEYELNPCDFGFKQIWAANLEAGWAGEFRCRVTGYRPGDDGYFEVMPDYGEDDNNMRRFHASDPNNMLIQVRLVTVTDWGIVNNGSEAANITPNGVTGVLPCTSSWDC